MLMTQSSLSGVQHAKDKVKIQHTPEPKDSFDKLKEKGLPITNYREEFPK